MPRKINITPRARADLYNIWEYTVENWSEKQANKYISSIHDRLNNLSETPFIGKQRKDIASGYYSFPCLEHLIFYLIQEDSIDIIGVPHQQMDILHYFDD